MAVGTCAASLPGIPDPSRSSISKSLPIPTKEFLRKCLAQLAFSDRDKPQIKPIVIPPSKVTFSSDMPNNCQVRVSSSPRPVQGIQKSRERTFDLLTLVPASPHSVMAPPPSPAAKEIRKKMTHLNAQDQDSKRHRKQDPFQNLTSEELEMDFIFEDVSSGSPTLKFSGDEDDNKKSFYLEDDFDEGNPADLSMKDNLGNEQDKELNQSMKAPQFDLLQVPKILSLTASRSLGNNYCEDLTESEAFDIVRELEFQDPNWIPKSISNTLPLFSGSPSRHLEGSGWRKLQSMVHWSPFIQTFKNRRYQWVQLAGHSGNFKLGKNPGTVLKKICFQEEKCYKQFKKDTLSPFVPKYHGNVFIDNEKFIQLQDCLSSFNLPSIMDCKIGVRTYLEEELAKAQENPKLRKDMYEKMLAIDPSAPTQEEHRLQAVTKPRYMVWRETISSTATFGFRIEGVKKNDGTSSKEFKTIRTEEQILDSFKNFISGSVITAKQYLDRLKAIRQALTTSEFFKSHELIGSSLLFIHDNTKANIWLIDFGKTIAVPDGISIDHKSPWKVGNHEDGYLTGIENLITLYTELVDLLEKEAIVEVPATAFFNANT